MKPHNWNVRNISSQALHIRDQLGVSVFLAQVLLNRGLRQEQFQAFLNPSAEHFHSAYLLPDIEKAANRIRQAVARQEKILVFGDYDVDGITSLAIFYEYSKQFPSLFSFYIPHRVYEGYGLNSEVIVRAKEEGVSLLIAFDCGTCAHKEIALASSFGIDTIVVDHHHPAKEPLETFAFINPKRIDCTYPFSESSAAVLSFKLLQVLTNASCHQVLDLVALSLVCDVVSLQGENRDLLVEGLKVLRTSKRYAIKALCDVAGIKQKNLDTFHIGYIIGPRINASGRVAHADDSLQLFLAESQEQADTLAARLDEHNSLRRNIEAQILKEAEQKISQSRCDPTTIVVSGEKWHPGVLGIVASRLSDKYGRPAFVISFDESRGVGSGRSVDGVHLIELLHQCADTLLLYGGHKKAAGVHIDRNELDNFTEKINALIQEQLNSEDCVPTLNIDACLDFDCIDELLLAELDKLKPYGEDNPRPLFMASGVHKKGIIRKNNSGYSVWLSSGNKTFEACVYDRDFLEIIDYAQTLDIVFSPEFNAYHNAPRLTIRDCRIAQNQNKFGSDLM